MHLANIHANVLSVYWRLWLAKEYADISFSEGGSGAGPLFSTLLQQVINCLHDRWDGGAWTRQQ
jgi:hypothetical protein